jgi:hypothetical protein
VYDGVVLMVNVEGKYEDARTRDYCRIDKLAQFEDGPRPLKPAGIQIQSGDVRVYRQSRVW